MTSGRTFKLEQLDQADYILGGGYKVSEEIYQSKSPKRDPADKTGDDGV